jgi:O-succinylbenzoic acid--CoA ligase
MEISLNQCPVRHHALKHPKHIAIESEQQLLTYQQLDQQLNHLTTQLLEKGLTAGDRLVCIAPNSIKLIQLQLCCLRTGIIFCPINARFSQHEVETRLTILNSPFIWCEEINFTLPTNSLEFDFTPSTADQQTQTELTIDSQRVIDIIFTSGSSGQPKAVMHNFSNHFYSAQGSQTLIPLLKGDYNLLSLPLYHISGYAAVFRTMLASARLVFSKQPITTALLQRYKITHLSLVATQLYRLLADPEFKKDNLAIKHLLLGGSAFSDQLLNQTLQRGLNYHLSYGLTEMSSQVATSCNNTTLSILPDREVKIIEGEILLRGKTRFIGYFNGHQTNELIPAKQWFASKDLGIKTNNNLHIIGRKDRQFICAGENIQPEEIETWLIALDEIKQAFIVPIEDPILGHRPIAFIDWQKAPLENEQINKYMRLKLAPFKCPAHYFPLPQQSGLKISLSALAKQARDLLN